jgi:phosphatidylserine/phosphatidylglycerophosphate/cardiolipin synthase-like enzyme
LKGAKRELLIYDVDLADKEMLRILEERSLAGVAIRIIGHAGTNKHVSGRQFRRMRLHTRVIIRDGKQVFLGSQSLRKLELEARREIGIIVNNAKIVSSIATVFEDDWKASLPANGKAEKKRAIAIANRASKKIARAVGKKLAPTPVVKQVLKTIAQETSVEVDPSQATQVVKGSFKKAVKKATEKIIEKAVAQ